MFKVILSKITSLSMGMETYSCKSASNTTVPVQKNTVGLIFSSVKIRVLCQERGGGGGRLRSVEHSCL